MACLGAEDSRIRERSRDIVDWCLGGCFEESGRGVLRFFDCCPTPTK